MNDKSEVPGHLVTFSAGVLDTVLATKGILPLASLGITGYNLAGSVFDRYFKKKGQRAFQDFENVDVKEMTAFCNSLGDRLEEFWTNVLLTIGRLDKEEKASICNLLLKALISGKIERDTYLRLVKTIEAVYYDDLEFLRNHFDNPIVEGLQLSRTDVAFENSEENEPIISNLVNAHLLKRQGVGILQHGTNLNSVVGHELTAQGNALLTIWMAE